MRFCSGKFVFIVSGVPERNIPDYFVVYPVAALRALIGGLSPPYMAMLVHLDPIYARLFEVFGPQHWWPAKTKVETVVGAILAQNTAWVNVERAIKNWRRTGALNWKGLQVLSEDDLAELIRPSGTFRIKAKRLKAFAERLWAEHSGSLAAMLSGGVEIARGRLLSIHGIGPETADAILLYAGNQPSFVVDAYTKRILRRHFFIDSAATYESVRQLFHESLPSDVQMYNEYHALLVTLAKAHCRTRARCDGCPLADLPHDESL